MGAGRDQAVKNADLRGLQDLIEVNTLHIALEKHGQRFITFGGIEQTTASLPKLENSFNDYCKMFDYKMTLDRRANKSLSRKLTSQIS